jgi:CxxC motif-containing protein (DUF1111 family)
MNTMHFKSKLNIKWSIAFAAGMLFLAAIGLSPVNADDKDAQQPAVAYDDQAPMTLEEKISAGRRKFNEPWSLRNELDGVWGLGPTYNEINCPACHQQASRSPAPGHGEEAQRGMVIRLSVPGRNEQGGPLPHPRYGDQLQNRGIANRVPREGRASVFYDEIKTSYADGEPVSLRKPRIEFRDLQFGELGRDILISPRIAPALFGLGLLEAVSEAELIELAKRQLEFGVSGKPNYVWDEEKQMTVLGRFGWKANQPSIRQQVAAALLNDIGATSSIFPLDNCPSVQALCRTDTTTTNCGGGETGCTGKLLHEVLPSRLETITTYLQALPVADRSVTVENAEVTEGQRLFKEAQCLACHVAELTTDGASVIPKHANITIRPYSDLLLHDMGEGLADGRPDFLADGHEWRTPPLWGIGSLGKLSGHSDLLHDGRARNIAEAILWHGGEAERAREAFVRLPKRQREALIKFVETL